MTDPLHPKTDGPQMPEPTHPAVYYCNKCGYYERAGPAHASCGYNAVQYGPHYSVEQMRAYAEALAAQRVERAVAAERERWTEAVMYELDSNGQAEAIVREYLGVFDTPEEAHRAYMQAKAA